MIHAIQADIDRLYFKRTLGGRGLTSFEDSLRMEQFNPLNYMDNKEKLMKYVKSEQILKSEINEVDSKGILEKYKVAREKKALY